MVRKNSEYTVQLPPGCRLVKIYWILACHFMANYAFQWLVDHVNSEDGWLH